MVSICISPKASDAELIFHVLICHLNTSFGKTSAQVFCPFSKWNVHFLTAVFRVPYILWIQILYWIYDLQILSSNCGLSFYLLKWVFCKTNDFFFYFYEAKFISFMNCTLGIMPEFSQVVVQEKKKINNCFLLTCV